MLFEPSVSSPQPLLTRPSHSFPSCPLRGGACLFPALLPTKRKKTSPLDFRILVPAALIGALGTRPRLASEERGTITVMIAVVAPTKKERSQRRLYLHDAETISLDSINNMLLYIFSLHILYIYTYM